MDIQLRVNGELLEFGMHRDNFLKTGYRKPGFFFRSRLKRSKKWTGFDGKSLVWLKNPEIISFNDSRTKIVGSDPNATSSEAIYGTSIFVFFEKNIPVHIAYQIFGSVIYARGFANDFRYCAFNKFGDCKFSSHIMIPRFHRDQRGERDAVYTAWSDSGNYLLCELKPSGDTCYIHFGSGSIPNEIDGMLINKAESLDMINDGRSPLAKINDDLHESLDKISKQ